MIDYISVGFEGSVREPVVSHELPDVFDGIELRGAGRERHQCDVLGDLELVGGVPAGLIEEDDGVRAGHHLRGDLFQMPLHGLCIAPGQDEGRTDAAGRANGAEDVGRSGSLIVGCAGPGASPGPSAGDLVLLADPGLILEPDLDLRAGGEPRSDRGYLVGEVFLNVVMVSGSWARWRGRAESLR